MNMVAHSEVNVWRQMEMLAESWLCAKYVEWKTALRLTKIKVDFFGAIINVS